MSNFSRRSALVVCLIGLACLALLPGCQGGVGAASATAPDTATLRLMSYNIRHGAGYDSKMNLPRQAEVIKAAHADWVALQEVDMGCNRSGNMMETTELARLAGFSHASFSKFMAFDGGTYGLGSLSNLPILERESVLLPEGREPRTANIDVVTVLGDTRRLALVTVHLDYPRDDAVRLAQARALIARLDALNLPAIIVGDFNDTPGSRTLELFTTAGFAPVPKSGNPFTFDARDPKIEIDHILVRSGPGLKLTPLTAEVIAESQASDHRPIVGNVKVRTE